MFGGLFMSPSFSEDENEYVQRFDTPTIRDLDFPPESANLPMPYQKTDSTEAPEHMAAAAEPAETQQTPVSGPVSQQEPAQKPVPEGHLDPRRIPKYANQLSKPPVFCPVPTTDDDDKPLYVIDASQFKQQILPEGFPETTVWGYGGTVIDEESHQIRYYKGTPGATFEAVRNAPIRVKWINKLREPHLFAVDPTLHWANPNGMPMDPPKPWPTYPTGFQAAQEPIPLVTHLHGGEVSSLSDGHPDAWFTADGKTGPACSTSIYTYPNSQDAATLWYHDHALGLTRLNVLAGLAGFYLLRSGKEFCWQRDAILPKGRYDIPIVIQDRSFNTDGSLSLAGSGVNPEIHPYWEPEFFGDTIMVNGKVWPNLDIERRQYRFRLLNGSNARFYNLRLSNGMPFIQIGTDGGFLPAPVTLQTLLLAPAERADILIDFSGAEPGTHITLLNDANAPYPGGSTPDPDTTGQIMRFTVPIDSPLPVLPKKLPGTMNSIPVLLPDSPQRILTLNEAQGPNGPKSVLLNGQKWEAPVSELPRVGSTEDWVIVNLTMDAHPIHLHLVQFQILNRQEFDTERYRVTWEIANGKLPLQNPTKILPIDSCLVGVPVPPEQNEAGWKDTVRVNPNQVTRIRVRFAPQNTPVSAAGPWRNQYPFDPHIGPGYVWHCHILDHEDNEMMRPLCFRQPK